MAATRPDARPLYAQVRDALKQDIQEGTWKPGDMLPSEFELAAGYGVSQGTVRKALDALTREHVLVRRQGIGTPMSCSGSSSSVMLTASASYPRAGRSARASARPPEPSATNSA